MAALKEKKHDHKRTKRSKNLAQFLSKVPLAGAELNLKSQKDYGRPVKARREGHTVGELRKVIEVVLDTNILVAALRSKLGASHRLLQTLEQRRWQPVVSPALAFEYEAVLKRGLPETGLALPDVDDFLEYLFSRSKLVQIYFRWRPAWRDPDDDRILELAVRTQAAIVTFNARHFAEVTQFGIRVVGPKEVLALAGGHE